MSLSTGTLTHVGPAKSTTALLSKSIPSPHDAHVSHPCPARTWANKAHQADLAHAGRLEAAERSWSRAMEEAKRRWAEERAAREEEWALAKGEMEATIRTAKGGYRLKKCSEMARRKVFPCGLVLKVGTILSWPNGIQRSYFYDMPILLAHRSDEAKARIAASEASLRDQFALRAEEERKARERELEAETSERQRVIAEVEAQSAKALGEAEAKYKELQVRGTEGGRRMAVSGHALT